MINQRKVFIFLNLILSTLLISSCAIKDLRDDLDTFEQSYGVFKGQASGVDQGSIVVEVIFIDQIQEFKNPDPIAGIQSLFLCQEFPELLWLDNLYG